MPTNRRDFLKRTASAGGVALGFGGLAPARALGAGERLRVGVLGSGQRAQYLMSLFNKVPDVACSSERIPTSKSSPYATSTNPTARKLSKAPPKMRRALASTARSWTAKTWTRSSSARRTIGTRRCSSTPSRPAKTFIVRSPSCTRSPRASKWCARSARPGASCKPGCSSEVGTTTSSAKRSWTPGSSAR